MPPLACACRQGPRDRLSVTSVACGCLNTGVHSAARKPSDGAGDETRVAGTWRISEMELWDQESIELMGPAFIEFGDDGMGRFRFIAVEGWMDCRPSHRDGRPCAEFSWEGQDDCDPASGRGWAALEKDGTLTGHIFIHCADDSAFSAIRASGDAT